MRSYIRHPSDIPIDCSPAAGGQARAERLSNVSCGGLCFSSSRPAAAGDVLQVRIGCVSPPFEALVRVSWCRACGERYEVGVAFLDPADGFRARMVEQICYIEHYRREVLRREGRVLSGEEAAREWIARHAADFPPPVPQILDRPGH